MTLEEDRKKELDQLWLDSLLQEALRPCRDRDQQRIQLLFSKADFESTEARSVIARRSDSMVGWA